MNMEPPCHKCPKPILLLDNYEVWTIFELLLGQPRMGGMGGFAGIDFSALKLIFEAFDIPRETWASYIIRLHRCSQVAVKLLNQKKDD